MTHYDIPFLYIFFTAPVFVFLLARRSGLIFHSITIPNILVLSYGLFAYVGIPVLYYGLDPNGIVYNVADKTILTFLLTYAAMAWIGLTMGYWIFIKLFGPISQIPPPVEVLFCKTQWVFILLLCGIGILTYGIYLSKVPSVALWSYLRNDDLAGTFIRSQMTNAIFLGRFDWQSLFYDDILLFFCFTMFSMSLLQKNLVLWLCWFGLIVFISTATLLSAQKAPLVNLAVGHFFVFSLTLNHGRFTARNLALLCMILAMSFGLIMVLLKPNLPYILSRIFTGSLLPAYYYLEIFPKMKAYLHGTSLSNLLGLLPFKQFNLPHEVHVMIFPEMAQQGIVGSAPTAFWGEAYANFGSIGPLLVAIPVGFCVCLLQSMLCLLPASPITVGLLTWSILHIYLLSITSFSNYITDQHLFTVATTALFMYFLGDRGFVQAFLVKIRNFFWTRLKYLAE